MAGFCTQCGRPLADGEVCQCQMVKSGGSYQKPQWNLPKLTGDSIPFLKLLGIGDSDKNSVKGCFEREKYVVPDLVEPCEDEIPVKQYHVCNVRSRIKGLWQEGRIQVTNKRILFRLSGRTWIGKTMKHTEFALDEVAGVSICNDVRFSLVDFIFGFLLSLLAFGLGRALGQVPTFLAFIFGLAALVPSFVLQKKHYIKALSLAVSASVFSAAAIRGQWAGENSHDIITGILMFFSVVAIILYIVSLFLFALKPGLSIQVMTKCASEKPIHIWNRQNIVSTLEILPGEDIDKATKDLGALITDLQNLGEAGIGKWMVK